jgi:hypothetical protein
MVLRRAGQWRLKVPNIDLAQMMKAVGDAILLSDKGGHLVGLGAGPVALQFQHVSQQDHRLDTGLNHAPRRRRRRKRWR